MTRRYIRDHDPQPIRDKAAAQIRRLRNAIRREKKRYMDGETDRYDEWYRLGMINGICILFSIHAYHPEWIIEAEYKLRKKREEAKAHAQPLADAVV